ncbi:hypothetical protein WJX84_002688 [Apatococcus fuscideae]|uniref:EF-hand domain-containing protein n=1 Tax=Apatococcus fuscideae TaxID=2026836 RepID=A0AAW1SS52_9CHLO
MVSEGEVTSKQKVDCVFQHFDADLDGALNQAELDQFIRSVNPGVPFNDDQVSAITTEVYSEYSEFLVNGGLSLAGLHQTYADGIGDIHRDFETLGLQKSMVLRDITPKKRGILEESRQQAVVSPPHRTRFVPAPAGKASSLPQQGALPSDAQPGSTPQSSADEPARLQQATGSNENKEQPVPLHQASPFQSPARTASVGRIGSEEMRQAEALVQATRGPAPAGVAGMIARFEAPAPPGAAEPCPEPSVAPSLAPQSAGIASQLAPPTAAQSHASYASEMGANGAAGRSQYGVQPPMDQPSQPNEMQRHMRRNLSNAASLPSPADTNAVFEKFMEAGFRAASRHDYDKAIRCFEQALSIRPDDPRVFFRLGNALFAQQRYAESRRCFGQSLELARLPEDGTLLPKVHVNLGIAMEAEGLLLGACEHYREAAAQNADHFRALKLLGSALYALGDFEGARHELQQALQLQPDYADALCDLGCTFCALGQTGNARKAFSDALLVAPDHLEALFNKGNLHRQCSDFEDAVMCYEHVLRLDNNHWRSLLNKAVAEIGLGRQDAAQRSLKAAYRLSGQGHALIDEVKLLKRMARRGEDRESLSRLMSQICDQAAFSNNTGSEETGTSNGALHREDSQELARLGLNAGGVQRQVDTVLCRSLQLFAPLPAAAYVMASQMASAAMNNPQDHLMAGPEIEALMCPCQSGARQPTPSSQHVILDPVYPRAVQHTWAVCSRRSLLAKLFTQCG